VLKVYTIPYPVEWRRDAVVPLDLAPPVREEGNALLPSSRAFVFSPPLLPWPFQRASCARAHQIPPAKRMSAPAATKSQAIEEPAYSKESAKSSSKSSMMS